MIRFRFTEDEQRFLSLMSEVYRTVAPRLSPSEMKVVLRNLGKMQDLLQLEGVRQGVAACAASTEIEGLRDARDMTPFQLHAAVYGSHDTPLREVELMHLQETVDDPWLDPHPMQFAPDTEAAFYASIQEASPPTSEHVAVDLTNELSDEPFDIDKYLMENEQGAQEEPQMIERMRDALQQMPEPPRSWEDLILKLHLAMHVDAGYLDLQLGTQMGRTMLTQVGLHLTPNPYGTDLSAIRELHSPIGDPIEPPFMEPPGDPIEPPFVEPPGDPIEPPEG